MDAQAVLEKYAAIRKEVEVTGNTGLFTPIFTELYDALTSQVAPIQPDWSKAPEWARYWAVDSDGTAYWYEFEPVILPGFSFEGWHPASFHSRWEEADSKIVQLWRNTLQERPQS